MPLFSKRVPVHVVEPLNIFEQLEDRIVLDATIDPIPDQAVNQDDVVSVDANCPAELTGDAEYGLEIDDGDGFVSWTDWNLNNHPAAADISFDPATGRMDWTPNNLDVGDYILRVTATDNDPVNNPEPWTDTKLFAVSVADLPPLITTPDNATFVEDAGVQTFDVDCDDEGKGIIYSLIGAPDGVAIHPDTGVISSDPDDGLVGFHIFTVRAADAHAFYDQTFELTVVNTMDFDSPDNTTVVEDDALLFDVDTDTETYGEIAVTYTLIGAPDWVSIDPGTGVITGNPTNQHVEDSSYTFTVRADDGTESLDQTFTLTVFNNPPSFLNVQLDFYMVERSGIQTFDLQVDDEGDPPPSGMPGYGLVSLDGGAVPPWLSIDSDTGIISGTPVNQDVGSYSLVVEFDDGNGGVEQLTLSVHVANIELFYTSASATTWREDVAGQTFDVQTSEEGDGVTYSFAGGALTWNDWISIDPVTGVLSALGDQPDNSRVGNHTFSIFADEGHGAPPIEQVFTLTVMNTPPVIITTNGSAQEDSGAEMRIPVELQDPEPGADWSVLFPPTLPSGGTIGIDPISGEIIVPAPDNRDVGTYAVNVKVDDGNGGVMYQMVTIEIINRDPVWDWGGGPVLTDITVDQGDPVSYDFNADDEGQNPPTQSTRYSILSGPSWLSISSTGQISGTPSNAHVGDHNVTVEFDDANGGVITHSFTIHVNNIDPVMTPAGPFIMTEDTGYYFFDIDSNEEGDGPVTYSLGADAPPWLSGVFNTTNGTFSLVPLNEHVGLWTFDVTVHDGWGGTDTHAYTVEVINNPPLWNPDPSPGDYRVTVDIHRGAQFFDLHTTDENSDNNNEYVIDLSSVTLPSWLTISVDPKTGIVTIDPSGPGPDPKNETTLSFPVRFFDGTVWIEENLVLTVTATPPGVTDPDYDDDFFSMNNTRFLEDEADQHFDIQYSGEDGGVTVTYSFDTSDPYVSADGLTYRGWLTIDASSGILTGSPINSEVTSPIDGNPYVFDVIVWQGGSELDRQADFRLHVDNVEPIFTNPPRTVTIIEDTTPAGAVLADVNTTDEGHGTETSYSIIDGADTVPAWIEIDEGTGEISINRVLDNDDDHRTWNLQVRFDDGHGGVITQPLTVTLQNRFGFTTPNTAKWGEDSSPFSFDVDTNDDEHPGAVTFWLSGVPAWLSGNISIDPNTGVISTTPGFEPDNTQVGPHTFTVNANDGWGDISQTFTLQIYNRDPVFDPAVNYADLRIQEDLGDQIIDIHVDDEGQGPTYYTMSGAPTWMYIDPYTGEIHGNPTNEHVGDYTFTVTAWDRNQRYHYGEPNIDGRTDQVVTVIVENRPPVFFTDPFVSVDEDSPLSYNVQTDDESVGGTTYELIGADPWIEIDGETGIITANPTNAHVGTHIFTVRVDDQNGGIVDQEFTLTVNNVAPTFKNPNSTTYTLTLTEDTTGNFFDLLTDDEFQHNSYANGGSGSKVFYSIDPSTTPPGFRFADDGGNGFDPDAYGNTKSYSGKLTINPTNRDVGTFTFPVVIDDGNGGVTTLDFTLTVINTVPRFTTPNKAVWYEDQTALYPFNVYTTDEPHDHWLKNDNLYTLIGAPVWLEIDTKDGTMRVNPVHTANADGSPDNHLVGVYTFTIDFFDGDVSIRQPFTLTIENTPTGIDLAPSDSVVDQDSAWVVDPDDVHAIDEYPNMPGYEQDYYELYIQVENQGVWYRVDGGPTSEYNTANEAWNGADITFDPETGAITWIPNNADVPNSPDGDGLLRHQFQIIHYDGWGTQDDAYFYLYVRNLPPTLPALDHWELREDTAWGRVGGASGTVYGTTTYPESLVESNEEGVGVIYGLWVDGVPADQADPLGDPDYVALQPNGPNGGWVRFNIHTGEIQWDTTNADVTVLEGDVLPLRDPYVFSVQADDGNAAADPAGDNLSPVQQFNVTVYNAPTSITAAPAGGTITEDAGFTFNIQAVDEEVERPGADPDYRNTYYTLEINDGLITDLDADPDWVDWNYYNAHNGIRADITFDPDTGLFGWDPNHSDTLHTSDYQFRVIHHDGHGSSDVAAFVYTVDNRPAEVDHPVQWDLVEDDTAANSTLDLDSDDDAYTAVTFELRISTNGGSTWIPWVSGLRPNGPHGGEIIFNGVTGEIQWQTTNEDVTHTITGGTITGHQAYQFQVRTWDGIDYSDWSDGQFSVRVLNTPTAFTTDVTDQLLTQDVLWVIDDAEVNAIDEYPNEPGYDADDYYYLYIDWENQGTWRRVDGGPTSPFNTWNNSFNGADIIFDTKTGRIEWTPNNADVPNTPDSGGNYRHEFRIRHYDAHGSNVSDYFFVYFVNITPSLDPLPDWELMEDTAWSKILEPLPAGTEYADWIYPENYVNSDEEGYGVTYDLEISLDGGTSWDDWDSFTGAWTGSRPNGEHGGVIVFNPVNGEILWATTNADVTIQEDGVTPARSPYVFRIQADDGNPSDNLSGWEYFDVIVYNDPTIITDYPTDRQITEDTTFTYDIEATDEEVERPDPSAINTYYSLEVFEGGSWIIHSNGIDGYNEINGLLADVTFDTDRGQFQWTPNHADSQIGSRDFRVTHYDAYGSSDQKVFTLTVVNRPPVINLPPGGVWELTEDQTEAAGDLVTYTFTSDDDDPIGYTDVTYLVQIYADLDADGTWAWETVTSGGIRPNGPDGGLLQYDDATDTVKWETANADTTLATPADGGGQTSPVHQFRVYADDGLGTGDWNYFDVQVHNDPTVIENPLPATQAVVQNATLSHDFTARDEEQERPATHDHFDNTYYTLEVSTDGGATWITYSNGVDGYNEVNGLRADVIFDVDAGVFSWTPNNLDAVAGVLDFRITHYDGNDSSDQHRFEATVTNVPPSLDELPSWELREDTAWSKVLEPLPAGTEYTTWIYPESYVNSDEEGYGVTYALEISLDGGLTYSDWDSFTGTWTGSRPNGEHGGVIVFNPVNGEILWTTTNADVTIQEDGVTPARSPYVFRIEADDGAASGNLSGWEYFDVIVYNDPTEITDHPADQNIMEDSLFTYNIEARDEEV
ncbi:MAG: putative Ig domain-containing protein, partial [Desulfomonilaceae bacterium]|nr:putative Ig domain-containing protein [Desulfomonilaceae bacterium]